MHRPAVVRGSLRREATTAYSAARDATGLMRTPGTSFARLVPNPSPAGTNRHPEPYVLIDAEEEPYLRAALVGCCRNTAADGSCDSDRRKPLEHHRTSARHRLVLASDGTCSPTGREYTPHEGGRGDAEAHGTRRCPHVVPDAVPAVALSGLGRRDVAPRRGRLCESTRHPASRGAASRKAPRDHQDPDVREDQPSPERGALGPARCAGRLALGLWLPHPLRQWQRRHLLRLAQPARSGQPVDHVVRPGTDGVLPLQRSPDRDRQAGPLARVLDGPQPLEVPETHPNEILDRAPDGGGWFPGLELTWRPRAGTPG